MSDFRETRIERDSEGRVVGSTERIVNRDAANTRPDNSAANSRPIYATPERKKGGFGRGLLFGIVLVALALIVFALTQGGFTEAGREADQAAAAAEQQVDRAAENAGDAAERAGDNIERATD
jgi:hypothetical protein